MRAVVLWLAAAAAAIAQVPCIQISQTLYVAGGSRPALMNGTITLSIGYTAQDGDFTVVQSEAPLTIAGGHLSTCQPAGASIEAHYSINPTPPLTKKIEYDRYWTMPASGGPYKLSDTPAGADGPIEQQTFAPPFPATIVGPAGPAGSATIYQPAWQQVSGLPAGSWAFNDYRKGEHAIVHGGKLFAPLEDRSGTFTGSGIGEFDPATGQLLGFAEVQSPCVEAAPAFDNEGYLHVHSCSLANGGSGTFIAKIDPSTMTVVDMLTTGGGADWEAVAYDATNDNLLVVASNGLRAVHASDYTTVWTNTDVNPGSCGVCGIDPVLIQGGYAYWSDYSGVLYKIRLTDGTTMASQPGVANPGGYAWAYAQMSYDATTSSIYLTNTANTAYRVNVSDLSIVWSKTLDTGFNFFRGGAFNAGIYYVTDRQTGPNYASKVYALDAASGNILWTNTTALDHEAQISSLLVDDTYVYATTHAHDAVIYNEILVIRRSDGSLAETIPLLHDVSSSIPAVYGGRLVVGLWDNFGYEAVQVRASGATGDWQYKADSAMTGYIGGAMTGALTTLSTSYNTAPPGGILVTAPNPLMQVRHFFLGGCGMFPIAEVMPCHIGASDLAASPHAGYVLSPNGDGTVDDTMQWIPNTPTAGGSNGQIEYNANGVIAGFSPRVNGVNVITPSGMDFINSAATNGLTYHFANPSLGQIQLSVTGTLDNAGLTHSYWTLALPTWLAGGGNIALGDTATISPATGQTPHQVIGTCGTAISFGPCPLQASDIPALNYQSPLGFTPLNPANNLSELASAPTARANLGLGGSATLNVGSTAGTVAAGDDSRLSNARTPTAHASTHQFGGSDPVATATPAANAIPQAGAGGTLMATWLPLATGSADGYISHTDWSTFNGKQAALGFTPENSANKDAASGYPGLDASAKLKTSEMPTAIRTGGFTMLFRGSDAAAGTILYTKIPYACTITDWSISSDGTATIKVLRIADGGSSLPLAANSLNSSGVSLASGNDIHSTTVTDFSLGVGTSLSAWDKLGIDLFAASGATWVSFSLGCLK